MTPCLQYCQHCLGKLMCILIILMNIYEIILEIIINRWFIYNKNRRMKIIIEKMCLKDYVLLLLLTINIYYAHNKNNKVNNRFII